MPSKVSLPSAKADISPGCNNKKITKTPALQLNYERHQLHFSLLEKREQVYVCVCGRQRIDRMIDLHSKGFASEQWASGKRQKNKCNST